VSSLNEADDISQFVNAIILGFESVTFLYPMTEEHLYTLTGHAASGLRRRLRFASGNHGRARFRLKHELNILNVLKDYGIGQIPQLDTIRRLPDGGICAIYFDSEPTKFQDFANETIELEWPLRIGAILKFAQSLASLLSKTHTAGVFRKGLDNIELTSRWPFMHK
jgi:hypothetical protein